MRVKLNGELREVPDGIDVGALLAHLGVRRERVAVELNEEVVTKDRYDGRVIKVGDAVEIVAVMAGG